MVKNIKLPQTTLIDISKHIDVVQEYIQNAVEVSCGCLEDKKGMFTLLPPIEIRPQKNSFFDYDSKYEKGGSIEISPPENISNDMVHLISQMTTQIHQALGCKTHSRSDFFVKGEDIIYLETNTLPGMTETSLLQKEAKAAGISFTELLDRLKGILSDVISTLQYLHIRRCFIFYSCHWNQSKCAACLTLPNKQHCVDQQNCLAAAQLVAAGIHERARIA